MEYKHQEIKVGEIYVISLFDLDLDPMTLTLKLYLDMINMYLYAEDEFPPLVVQKLQPRQTDRDRPN